MFSKCGGCCKRNIVSARPKFLKKIKCQGGKGIFLFRIKGKLYGIYAVLFLGLGDTLLF